MNAFHWNLFLKLDFVHVLHDLIILFFTIEINVLPRKLLIEREQFLGLFSETY